MVLSKNGQVSSSTFTPCSANRLKELKLETRVQPIHHGMAFVNHALGQGNCFLLIGRKKTSCCLAPHQ
jgi:hypothetical protein